MVDRVDLFIMQGCNGSRGHIQSDSVSTIEGFRAALLTDTMMPVCEKNLLEGSDVVCTDSRTLAAAVILGCSSSLGDHHLRGISVLANFRFG